MEKKKILFVCTGNTCRSPMAEVIMRYRLKTYKIKNYSVGSVGLYIEETQIAENALKILAVNNLKPYKNFRPRKITDKQLRDSLLIVCMTENHLNAIGRANNVICAKDIIGYDISDPYGGDLYVYAETAKQIDYLCVKIIEKYILGE